MEFKTKQCKLCNSEFKSRAGLSHHRRSERTFCKIVFSPLKIQKNLENFQKMIKLLLDKQNFASSDARFCSDMHNNGHFTQNFVHNKYWFCKSEFPSPTGWCQ